MQLVSVLFVTMALSVYQLVQTAITQMAWIANSAMNCVLVDAQGQGISLAKEDAMHVILSNFIGMTHRCICVVCWCAGVVCCGACMLCCVLVC